MICRINFPYNSEGLCTGSPKRSVSTPSLGFISVCKEHRRSAGFCGVCLREAPRGELEEDYTHGIPVCCVDNEDTETWPGIEATCRACRSEALWRRVSMRPEWREALNSARWASLDWETRQSVETFIDLGEGSIRDVLQIAEEKHWLRTYTKLVGMLQQAMAASRFASRAEAGEAYESDEEISDDEVEDPEMLSLTEEAGGIRDLALNDWARNRILDGHWISPADEWFNYYNGARPRFSPALHPCPYNRHAIYEGALDDGQADEAQELEHPRPKTLCPHPPSFTLCEQAFRAYQRQMREILLPPMRNIVRKVVMECAADGVDPAMRAVRMTTEDVVQELRDESVWYNGIDWLERRANLRLEEDRRRAKDEDESSTSSHSGGSHTTSPVLSTTTLQTTPSPPPSSKDDEPVVSSPLVGVPPALSPVLKAPELLRPIPFVPVTAEHMPHHSRETFDFVSPPSCCGTHLLTQSSQTWREACSPLYRCQCSICERAMLNANMTADAAPTQAQVSPTAQVQSQPPAQSPVQISIQEMAVVSEQLPAEEAEDDLDESEEEFEDGESERADDTSISVPGSPGALSTPQAQSRKRSCSDLELDTLPDALFLTTNADLEDRSRTPPKRVRREGSYEHSKSPSIVTAPPASSSPGRQRKRSSEELEEGDELVHASGKRLRPEVIETPPTRLGVLSPESTPTTIREKVAQDGSVLAN